MLRLEAEALELQLVNLGLLSSEDREALWSARSFVPARLLV
jgi:hypothetical protein